MEQFHPYRFHPTRYAEDPYDLLLPIVDKDRPKFRGVCIKCGVEVERDIPPKKRTETTGYYKCYDCYREDSMLRSRKYRAKKKGATD